MGHHRTKVAMRQENADVNNKSEEVDHQMEGREKKNSNLGRGELFVSSRVSYEGNSVHFNHV